MVYAARARPVRGRCAACARGLFTTCARGLGRGSGSVVEARFARFRRAGDALQKRHVLLMLFQGASDAVPRGCFRRRSGLRCHFRHRAGCQRHEWHIKKNKKKRSTGLEPVTMD